MFVRKKSGKGRDYYQLVEGYRVEGKVRQRVLLHLGQYATVDEALAGWEWWAKAKRDHARDHLRAAKLIRERRAYRSPGGKKYLVPRHETPEDARPYSGGMMAPSGFFYCEGAEYAEQAAEDYQRRAEALEAKIERLRSLCLTPRPDAPHS